MEIPVHVAIILDGNGRWAKKRGMPRTYGHTVGAKNVETICRAADKMGIHYLTMYAFSTENWNRPAEEVKTLMKLLESYLESCRQKAKKNNMRIRILGEKEGLPVSLQEKIDLVEQETAPYTGLNFQIAINYGSRNEMIRAMQKMTRDIFTEAGEHNWNKEEMAAAVEKEITEDTFSGYLDTREIPDPDLLIRTSGEQRLSNYLLWQMAYTEFYFTDVAWPDFNEEKLNEAIMAYQNRNRRFGKV